MERLQTELERQRVWRSW